MGENVPPLAATGSPTPFNFPSLRQTLLQAKITSSLIVSIMKKDLATLENHWTRNYNGLFK
jgi:hypothetical protein